MSHLPQLKLRLLKPINSKFIPTVFLLFDSETRAFYDHKGESQRFYMGWVCLWVRGKAGGGDFTRWSYFDNELLLNRYLHKTAIKYGNVILAGHNIFFDLQACGFFDYFTRWGWRLEFYYDQGMTYILKCTLKGVKMTVVSTTNWFDCSLAELGRLVGLEKGSVEFDKVSDEELERYCRRDVEIMLEGLRYYIRFISDNDLGRMSLTRSSQAFSVYRYRWMSARIFLHDEKQVTTLESNCYIGGRVEAFYIGEVPGGGFTTFDINGMYPYVMRKYLYPSKLVDYIQNPTINYLADVVKSFGVCCEADISTDIPVYGIGYNDRTCFPVGEFTAFLCTEGIKFALAHNHILKVHSVSVYRMDDLFSWYVDYIHSLRCRYRDEGNRIMESLCKSLHNSLYGKFGQKHVNCEFEPYEGDARYYRTETFDFVKGGSVVESWLMNTHIIQWGEGVSDTSFTAVAAHITENARLELWELMESVGRERVIYCDTDSIKIRTSDIPHMRWDQTPGALGAVKIENQSERLFIGGAKNYLTENTRHIKGVPSGAREIAEGLYAFDSFSRQATHLRSSQIVGVKVEGVTRYIKSDYDKGTIMPDGRVIPFTLKLAPMQVTQEELPF